jgi:hypothetical protein
MFLVPDVVTPQRDIDGHIQQVLIRTDHIQLVTDKRMSNFYLINYFLFASFILLNRQIQVFQLFHF